eukprot:2122006-Pleurochrysis_carterae.AAC.1
MSCSACGCVNSLISAWIRARRQSMPSRGDRLGVVGRLGRLCTHGWGYATQLLAASSGIASLP